MGDWTPSATQAEGEPPLALTQSGHLMEAYKAMRRALDRHTEPLQGYTANKQRDDALDEAANHIAAFQKAASS